MAFPLQHRLRFDTLPTFLLTTPLVNQQARSRSSYPTCSGFFLVLLTHLSLTICHFAENQEKPMSLQ
jgi:hypothetical protein